MRTPIIAGALPLLFAAGLAAQNPPPPQTPPTQTPPRTPAPTTPAPTTQRPSDAVRPTTTLSGCLYKESQVPGRTPNPVERAGILEDYIIADASVAGTQSRPGSTPGAPPATPGAAPAPGATATPGGATPTTGNMYKVEGPSDEKLKELVGKRVEVTGKIDPEGGPAASPGTPTPDRGVGPDKINLPEFEAASIREVSGNCPSAPAPRK